MGKVADLRAFKEETEYVLTCPECGAAEWYLNVMLNSDGSWSLKSVECVGCGRSQLSD